MHLFGKLKSCLVQVEVILQFAGLMLGISIDGA
jgi:hypothetical protein